MTTFGSDLILARLERLHPKKIDLSLGRMELLLERLGRPERQLPPVIHVAGTNGKGSTLAFLDAMLKAQGCVVDRYISPHLVRFNERMLIDGEPIEETELARVLDLAESANDGAPITFFEITTAAAMLAFVEHRADYLLLETGLGGRLDATNVVERPVLTLITPISMDHEAFLGDRLERIAFEKAGILKPDVMALSGPQEPTAMAVLAQRAATVGAPLHFHGREWQIEMVGRELRFTDGYETLALPRPALEGVHQIENAGLAIAAARSLGVANEAIAGGLSTARWPGRLQRLTQGPLVEKLGKSHQLRIDGGHNPAAGQRLAESLDVFATLTPVHLVIGMLDTKDFLGFLRPLASRAESMTFVRIPGVKASRDPEEMRALAATIGIEAKAVETVEAAIAGLADRHLSPSCVLICGNLYLTGHILRDHE